MIRRLWIGWCILGAGCPTADSADVAVRSAVPDVSASSDQTATKQVAQDGSNIASEIVATATISEVVNEPPGPDVSGATGAGDEVASVISWHADDGLGFAGLPGVSADGMHLAFIEAERGRVALQVRRLDGELLVEKVLIEASEVSDAAALQRRVRGRALNAQKVLAQAGMRGLEARREALVERDGRMVARVPGFEALTVDKLPLAKCGAADIAATFVDPEHGLVVVNVVPSGECAKGAEQYAWHVLTLTALP